MLAFDTETRSFRWWDNPAFLGSWSDGGEPRTARLPAGGGDGTELAARLRGARHLIGANTKFDAHMVREALGIETMGDAAEARGVEVDDVILMSRLNYGNLRQSHGLKEQAVDHIDPHAADAEKDMQAMYKALTGRTRMDHDDAYYITWKAHPDVVELYAGLDAAYTYALRDFHMERLKADAKLLSLYRLEQKVGHVLYEAEKQGVHVDPEAVTRLSQHYHERDAAARSALESTLGFVPEGTGSEEALREGLINVGVPLTELTEHGEVAINRNVLQKYSDHPAVAALFEFRRVKKFLETYLTPLLDTDHIHPTFNQAQAWTGRMSGSNPNMQNLPKRTETTLDENMRIRSVFIPEPDTEFIIADFESIEMRVLAWYLGVPEYRREIDAGDPHSFTAAAAAQVLGMKSNRPEDYRKSTPNRWFRDIAKQGTYSIVYGGGGPVVMNTINKMVVDAGHPEFIVNLEQAREIRKRITGAIPGFKALTDSPYKGRQWPKGRLYQQMEKSRVTVNGKDYGYVRTLLGRKQWISFDKSYVALSGEIQGSAADIMKQAAVNIAAAMKPYGGRLILVVHDEAVVQVPKGWGERLKPLVVEAMEAAAQIDPPLRVEAGVTARSYAHHD